MFRFKSDVYLTSCTGNSRVLVSTLQQRQTLRTPPGIRQIAHQRIWLSPVPVYWPMLSRKGPTNPSLHRGALVSTSACSIHFSSFSNLHLEDSKVFALMGFGKSIIYTGQANSVATLYSKPSCSFYIKTKVSWCGWWLDSNIKKQIKERTWQLYKWKWRWTEL